MKKIKNNADFFNQYGLFIDRNQEIKEDLIFKSINQDEKFQLKIILDEIEKSEINIYRIIVENEEIV